MWLQGGKDWDSMAEFMSRYGVADMQQSADKVLQVIRNQVGWQGYTNQRMSQIAVCCVAVWRH